ncbi:MAG: TrkA family potassium uptake protein [Lachnospiraceae bacterium]|nr:TrkA family potassium uptake protein [Lachnospiraceae bacterium]
MKRKEDKKSYAVFGLGEFGRSVAVELAAAGAEVMVLDKDEEQISDIADKVTLAMQIDASEMHALETLGLSNMDGVIVAMTGCLDACIMAILAAKEAGVPFVIAKSQNATQTTIFQRIGADKIVTPEHDGGIRLARNIIAGNFLDFFELSNRLRMVEMAIKKEWAGKSLKQLSLRKRHKINVIAIRQDGELTTDIDPDAPLREEDTILIIVDKKYIQELLT